MDKIAINQNIDSTVAFWRMKKIAFEIKYDRSVGRIKKFANFIKILHKVTDNNNKKEKRAFFSNLKYYNFNAIKNQFYNRNSNFVTLIKRIVNEQARDGFNAVLEYSPQNILCKYMIGKHRVLQRTCFRSLRFLVKKEKLICLYRFMEVINRNLFRKLESMRKITSPYEQATELVVRNQNRKLKNCLKFIYKKSQGFNQKTISTFCQKSEYLINKLGKQQAFNGLKSNTKELFKKNQQQNAQSAALIFQQIYVRKLKQGFDKILNKEGDLGDGKEQARVWRFLNTLDSTYKEKLKHLLQILQKESLGNKRLTKAFLRNVSVIYLLKKWQCLKLLYRNCDFEKKTITKEQKIKNFLRDLQSSMHIQKLLIFQKLKGQQDNKKFIKEKALTRIVNSAQMNMLKGIYGMRNIQQTKQISQEDKNNKLLRKVFGIMNNSNQHAQKHFLNYLKDWKNWREENEQNDKINQTIGLALLGGVLKRKLQNQQLNSLQTLKLKSQVPLRNFEFFQKLDQILKKSQKDAFNKINEKLLLQKLKKQQILENLFKIGESKKVKAMNRLIEYNSNDKKKLYFLTNIAKTLVQKYKMKKEQAIDKLRFPDKEKNLKQNATNKIVEFMEKIWRKNHQTPLRKMGLKSNLTFGRWIYILKKIIMRKNFDRVEESFLLLKALDSRDYPKYLANPQLLVQMKKMMQKRKKNDDIYSQILMEPCYYVLKKNAGLLKKHEYDHLRNLMYLLRKQNGLYLSNHQIFTNKKNKNDKFMKIRNDFIEMLKENMQVINGLKTQNEEIIVQLDEFENLEQNKKQKLNDQIECLDSELIQIKSQFIKNNQVLKDNLTAVEILKKNQKNDNEQMSEIEKLKKEIAELKDQISKSMELIKIQRGKIENHNSIEEQLLLQKQNLENQMIDQEDQIKQILNQIEKLGAENIDIIQILAMIDKLMQEIKDLKINIAQQDLDEEVIHVNMKDCDLEMQKIQKQIQYQNQYNTYEEFLADKEDIQKQFQQANENYQQLQQQKIDLTNQMKDIQSSDLEENEKSEQLEILKNKLAKLNGEIEVSEELLFSLKRLNQEMQNINEFESEEELQKKRNQIQQQNQEFIEQLEEIRQQKSKLELELYEKEQELQKLRDKFPNGRETIENNSKEMEIQRLKIVPLQKKMKEIQQCLQNNSIEMNENEINFKQIKLNEIQTLLEGQNEELKRKQDLLQKLNGGDQNSLLQGQQYTQLQSEIEKLKKEQILLSQEINDKQSEIEKFKREQKQYMNQIENYQNQLKLNNEKIQNLELVIKKTLEEFKKHSQIKSRKILPKYEPQNMVDEEIAIESMKRIPTGQYHQLEQIQFEIEEFKLKQPQIEYRTSENVQNFLKKNLLNKLKDIKNNRLKKAFQLIKFKAKNNPLETTIISGPTQTGSQNNVPKLRLSFLLDKLFRDRLHRNFSDLFLNTNIKATQQVFRHFLKLKEKVFQKKLQESQKNQSNGNNDQFKALSLIVKKFELDQIKSWFLIKFEIQKEVLLHNYSVIYKLRRINQKYCDIKKKHYLRKWYSQRTENPWISPVMTNMIQKTPITGQIALWRMKINKEIPKQQINPYKIVAAILMKKAIQNNIYDNYAIFLYNFEVSIPPMDHAGFIDFDTVTHGTPYESFYDTVTSGIDKNAQEGSYISKNKKTFVKKDPKYIIFQLLSGFFKKKNFQEIYNAFKKIKEQQPLQVIPIKKQTKSEQQSQLIKFLLEQNMINKKTLSEKLNMIEKQQEEIYEKKRQLHFVKDHYQYIFLRKVQESIERINYEELIYSWNLFKEQKKSK